MSVLIVGCVALSVVSLFCQVCALLPSSVLLGHKVRFQYHRDEASALRVCWIMLAVMSGALAGLCALIVLAQAGAL